MSLILRPSISLLGLMVVVIAWGQAFTPGQIAVLQYPAGLLTGGAYVIQEYTYDGTPGAMHQVPSTGPTAVIGEMSLAAGSELARTPDGSALVFTGFISTAPPGYYSVSSTPASVVPRAVGRVDASGNFSRPATTSTLFSNKVMSHVATDGVNLWVSGVGSGLCYLGPGSPAQMSTTPSPFRGVDYCNGQLFWSAGSNVYRVGNGGPTGPDVLSLELPSSSLDMDLSPDGNTLYLVPGFDRVAKWEKVGGAWTHAYDLLCAPNNWLIRIAVDWTGAEPVVFGVHNGPNKLVKWVDQGAGSPEQLLATSTTGNWYGVALAPADCMPGTSCDDGDPLTSNEVWTASCQCVGAAVDCAGTPDGPALPGSPCDDGDPQTGGDVYGTDCTCAGGTVRLAAKVLLDGALPAGSIVMWDSLRLLPDFPLSEPYSARGLPPTGGATTIAPSVLAQAGNDAIVDWLLVELRSSDDPSVVLARQAALLQRDGDVVELDGSSPVAIPHPEGSYHVALRHRNHLGVMTAQPRALSAQAVPLDFRLPTLLLHGQEAARTLPNSLRALWPGDVNSDGVLKYTGSMNDRDLVLNSVGASVPTGTASGYLDADLSLDGSVRYTGVGNDRDVLLGAIGGQVPTTTRTDQLP